MDKIYLVISACGEYEDYHEYNEKAFSDIKKAEKFMDDLKDSEDALRAQAALCRNCGGLNKECPFYEIPFFKDEDCANYQPYHDEVDFRIDEIEFEE